MVTQKAHLLAIISKYAATQELEQRLTKTLDLLTKHMTILGFETYLHKNFHCKFAILDINRMIKFRKFYLLEEWELAQKGKRHWRMGCMETSNEAWNWLEWLAERKKTRMRWLWLINWFLLGNMLLWPTSHKKSKMKILKANLIKNLNIIKNVL